MLNYQKNTEIKCDNGREKLKHGDEFSTTVPGEEEFLVRCINNVNLLLLSFRRLLQYKIRWCCLDVTKIYSKSKIHNV